MDSLSVLRLNIARYRRLLEAEKDSAKRRQITALLHEAQAAEAKSCSLRASAARAEGQRTPPRAAHYRTGQDHPADE